MENKEKIIEFYYINHLKVKEIQNLLKISSAYISRIIQTDSRYETEKIYRKELSSRNRKNAQNHFMKKKREKQKIEDNYSVVQSQHLQATRELSKGKHLTNENYRKWNYSAYRYNPSKRRYEFDSSLGRAADVPEYIKER